MSKSAVLQGESGTGITAFAKVNSWPSNLMQCKTLETSIIDLSSKLLEMSWMGLHSTTFGTKILRFVVSLYLHCACEVYLIVEN
jgi:hypothetical protein